MSLRVSRRVLAFACIGFLWGCLGAQAPAPVTHYGRSAGEGSAGVHTVSEGENLYLISSRYRLPIPDIVALNDVHAPFILQPGQRLRLPPPREYRVRPGDSLYEISRLFGTDTREIVRLNGLSAPYRLQSGETIRLPAPTTVQVAQNDRPRTSFRQRWQSFFAPDQERERLASSGFAPPPSEKPSPKSAETILGVSLEDLFSKRRSPVPLPSDAPPRTLKTSPASAPVRLAPPPPRSGSAFAWPVRGRILSGYGPKKGGLHNDGINIAASRGSPVQAAENGVVVYAGNGLEGYGNLVLIRHQDRWVTAYGHMDRVNVRKGDILRRGQTIGTAGSTGSVESPQLHFEIRRGTKALDPRPLLG